MFEQKDSSANERLKDAGLAYGEPAVARPAILLHSCCGPCSTAVVEQLAPRFRITIFFSNSNIDEEAEYLKRLNAQKDFITRYNTSARIYDPVSFVCPAYSPSAFLSLVRGKETCPEGGERCRLCIGDRLEKTAAYAAMNGFEYFTTTLSVSRHKSYEMILELGKMLALRYGLSFIDDDFKRGGEQRSVLLSKSYGLYRQNYCGCSFSKR